MTILVTGATGQLGSKVVQQLLEKVPASEVAVSVRNPEKAAHLKELGVDVRHGDFDKPETLDSAFAGVDRLLLISTDGDNETRIRQHGEAAKAAARAGVGFIAYTSVGNAQESGLGLAPVHKATENAILETGLPYSFLRNNWYLENELSSIGAANAGAPWVTSAGDGKVGWATRDDYAAAAVAVLTGEGHENTIYELSGPLLTQEELAAAVGKVLGKDITVQQVDDETYAEIMKGAGLPDFLLPILVGIQQGIREHHLEVEHSDFEKVLGRPLTPLEEGIRQILA
ncbi:SDR family oxidoreductase [Paenibacillus hunanensis]|uniref:SDR family oxidoreductase n=1 Tax=Paenibacillus hunanensis TaxID=539262 RepID=UPI002026C881|nr:SDR family oxidoreductase [Paenibacillus hunanensis]MCL9661459.1 SDR family oxidoreductase [Paenibacillus hunanensis]